MSVFPADPHEFDHLAAEAAEWGLGGALPPVRRISAGPVSALRWGTAAVDTVLLHGVGLNAHTFDATVLGLAARAEPGVVAVDLPGHGDSAWREDADYRPRSMAGQVADLISACAAEPVRLVGQSLGGLTAIALAARRPELVSSLVIVDITPGLRTGDAAQVQNFLSVTEFASREEIVDRAIAFGLGASREALERGVALNTRVRPDGVVVFKHHFANLGDLRPAVADLAELWPDLEGLKVPVTLVRAEAGFLSPELVEEFRRRVPSAQVIQVPGGHNVQEQQPLLLAEVIASAM